MRLKLSLKSMIRYLYRYLHMLSSIKSSSCHFLRITRFSSNLLELALSYILLGQYLWSRDLVKKGNFRYGLRSLAMWLRSSSVPPSSFCFTLSLRRETCPTLHVRKQGKKKSRQQMMWSETMTCPYHIFYRSSSPSEDPLLDLEEGRVSNIASGERR